MARVVAPGYPHHITQRGTNKSDIFLTDKDYQYFLELLNQWLDKTKLKLSAYCLMRNHLHLLTTPDDSDGLGRCLHGVTSRYAQYFNTKYGRNGRLWQNRYFSCPVDRDEYLWAVVKYIEMNPVRAHIVKTPEEWSWSSAGEHIKGKVENNIRLHNWLRPEEREEYAKVMLERREEDRIRKATSSGRPLGGELFFDKLEGILNRELRPRKAGRPKKRGA